MWLEILFRFFSICSLSVVSLSFALLLSFARKNGSTCYAAPIVHRCGVNRILKHSSANHNIHSIGVASSPIHFICCLFFVVIVSTFEEFLIASLSTWWRIQLSFLFFFFHIHFKEFFIGSFFLFFVFSRFLLSFFFWYWCGRDSSIYLICSFNFVRSNHYNTKQQSLIRRRTPKKETVWFSTNRVSRINEEKKTTKNGHF